MWYRKDELKADAPKFGGKDSNLIVAEVIEEVAPIIRSEGSAARAVRRITEKDKNRNRNNSSLNEDLLSEEEVKRLSKHAEDKEPPHVVHT